MIVLADNDRVMVLVPHPDDEVLGCGGVILRALKLGLPLKIVFFTYGDSNEWSFMVHRKYPAVIPQQVRKMGLVRSEEALQATKILGVPSDQVIFLGYPDFGTLRIWQSRWRDRPPLRSLFTKVRKVPYKNAFRPGALYKGDEILKDLKTIISRFAPTKIFLSHRHDFNTDHQALYLFTRIVLWDLERKFHTQFYPFLIHFDKWPYPRTYQPLEYLKAPSKLQTQIRWNELPLQVEEMKLKYEALNAHKTQINSNRKYLLSFMKMNELFGDYEQIRPSDRGTSLGKGAISASIPQEELVATDSPYVGLQDQTISLKNGIFGVAIQLSRFLPKREKIAQDQKGVISKQIESYLPVSKEGSLSPTVASILPKNVGVSCYVFGYRYDQAFEHMPKFWIRIGRKGYTVFDLAEQVARPIEVNRVGAQLKVQVPLDLLNHPDYLLVNVKNYIGLQTLDWVPWRIIKLKS